MCICTGINRVVVDLKKFEVVGFLTVHAERKVGELNTTYS